ncbi:MAG: ABC transporter ATP-binding protein [Candidatus Nezhaarchaeales archaeon]|nr:MAG: ABC transporter ATP-binding protein [Candidatus Nezhaarchaeota archaeon WYZ-LMO8]TDA37072.1 MAG: ABC transporter ATP-binding protein [Candidatus Nezhaarchaeota archaeon WYZ-LMO7]
MVIEISVRDVKVYYRSIKALDGVSISVNGGEVLSILGPNGAGKSTLLKVINGVLRPVMGVVYIDNKNLLKIPRRELARRIGIVPQRVHLATLLSVYDFVMTGRRSYINLFPTKIDEEKVYEALKVVGALELANRSLDELSGGELQRVVIARALAGEPEVLLLDEPTNNLDLKYQIEVLNLIRSLRSRGLTIIVALHDLTQAFRISDKVLLLKGGRVYAVGRPEEVLKPEVIFEVYGVPTIVIREHKIIAPLFQ